MRFYGYGKDEDVLVPITTLTPVIKQSNVARTSPVLCKEMMQHEGGHPYCTLNFKHDGAHAFDTSHRLKVGRPSHQPLWLA